MIHGLYCAMKLFKSPAQFLNDPRNSREQLGTRSPSIEPGHHHKHQLCHLLCHGGGAGAAGACDGAPAQ